MMVDPFWMQFYDPMVNERFGLWTQYIRDSRDQWDEGPDPLVVAAWEALSEVKLR